MAASPGNAKRTLLRHAAIAFGVVGAAIALLVRVDIELPLLGHLGSALAAVLLLYTPVLVAWRRREDLHDYGLRSAPLGRGLALGLGVPLLVIFPLFALGYVAFYQLACAPDSQLAVLTTPGACLRWSQPGLFTGSLPAIDVLLEFALIQLAVVALPEELFFRGMLLGLLERAWPPARRVLGGGLGLALVVSALAFAVIHLPKAGDPRALATFFPGLLFGWMRSATGSILAPVLAHAGSNVLIRVLDEVMLG